MSTAIGKVLNLIDGSFEWLFRMILPGRYPLQPITVEKAIQKAITENTKVFKNGVLPPNRITVFMSEEDYAEFRKVEKIYAGQLQRTAECFLEDSLQEQAMVSCRPVVSVEVDSAVSKGDIRIQADYDETGYEGRT